MQNYRLSLRPLALAVLLATSGMAMAQSNITGSIYGSAQPGQTVLIRNQDTGLTRTIPVDADGKYRALALPTGQYKIELQKDGATIAQRDVLVQIASGSQIDFVANTAKDATTLDGVTVQGSVAALDMSQTDARSVFTAEDIERLPMGGNVQDIAAVALLAPGVVAATGSNFVSFGGSSGAENAYFINGYPVTNPLNNLGYKSLPFRAIDQEQVLTGGYGAEFGRSTGGVINIVTKRGSNEWHGGAYVRWTPKSLKGKPKNEYYPDTGYWNANNHPAGTTAKDWSDGQMYTYKRDNGSTSTSAGIWASGPLIKDRLFLFANIERQQTDGQSNGTHFFGVTGSPTGWNDYRNTYPRWAGKLDWNITDNQILELTAIQDRTQYETYTSSWDNATLSHGNEHVATGSFTDDNARLYIAKYTNYLTDNLIVSAMYGTQKIKHGSTPMGLGPDNCVYFVKPNAATQVPGLTYIDPCQKIRSIDNPNAFDETKGWRLDVAWTLGKHELHFGVDSLNAESLTGTRYTGLPNGDAVGPGNAAYGYWVFAKATKPTAAISGSVGSPASGGGYGTQGYYAYYQIQNNQENPTTKQLSQFIEDRWHITDNLLLSLGLRNEQFTNYTTARVAYMQQKWQPAPRLGFTWNLFGDDSLKLYGNLGRYHLALPARIATASTLSSRIRGTQYYTYTGIDPVTGVPTGLTKIPVSTAPGNAICPGTNMYSGNLDCGVAKDPRARVAADLKPSYQDELILGMDQVVNANWNWGVKGTYRQLRSVVDDSCPDIFNGSCYLVNAGTSNAFWEKQTDGSYKKVTYTAEQLGMPKARRSYFAMDFYLEHPFSNGWSAKFLYTYSRSRGNTEGQINSDRATGGDSGYNDSTSTTQDFDKTLLMERAYGLLNNDRRHQFKAYGAYKLNDEWNFGGSMSMASGRPINCYAHHPIPQPAYDSAYYWYCGLPNTPEFKQTHRGSEGRTPWLYTFNINASYTPNWFKGLRLSVDVMNLFDTRTAVIYETRSTSSHTEINKLWKMPDYNDPRTVTFTASYSF
jgi:outer membrane receptor protein involved in Fe transport